jgi:enoyl-CoA hydratase
MKKSRIDVGGERQNMEYKNIILEKEISIEGKTRPVARITINRPRALNALNSDVLTEMEHALKEIDAPSYRALIITGAKHVLSDDEIAQAKAKGKEPRPMPAAFIAGADIKNMPTMTEKEGRAFIELGQRVMRAIENLPYPVVAAVDGFALGGGTELAISCDIIYASDRSAFGQPEVNLGIIPGFGGTQRLPRLVNRNIAKELIYTGDHISAAEALRIGLVNKVVAPDRLFAEVDTLVMKFLAKGPLAIRHSKQSIDSGMGRVLADALKIEVESFMQVLDTEDRVEGTKAFIEKRTANFKGK